MLTTFASAGATVENSEHDREAAITFAPGGVDRGGAALALNQPAEAVVDDNRVGFDRGGVVERWDNSPAGLVHGFTVTAPPAGREPLALSVEVAGATPYLVPGGEQVRFEADSGILQHLNYSGVYATDAGGRDLPVWLAVAAASIIIGVDDSEAAYPIKIDSVDANWLASDLTHAIVKKGSRDQDLIDLSERLDYVDDTGDGSLDRWHW